MQTRRLFFMVLAAPLAGWLVGCAGDPDKPLVVPEGMKTAVLNAEGMH